MARARSRRPGFFTVLRSRPELLVLGGILCVVAAIALVATIGALHNVAPSSWAATDPVLELDTGVRKEAFQDQLLVDLSDVRPMSTTMYACAWMHVQRACLMGGTACTHVDSHKGVGVYCTCLMRMRL